MSEVLTSGVAGVAPSDISGEYWYLPPFRGLQILKRKTDQI